MGVTQHLIALAIGFALDMAFGDPHWMPHPVRLIGRLISACEQALYRENASSRSQFARGVILVAIVVAVPTLLTVALLWTCNVVSMWLGLAVESIICYQMLACRQLKVESMSVYEALARGSIDEARKRVNMIVGRDTDALDEAGIAQAAVETVAENASDGVIAPLLYMAVFGAAGGVFYKAVNTADSMVGYVNERYRFFGTAAAKLDDALNWIPARISGVLMCIAAWFVRLDTSRAWHAFRRDRRKHSSPNSAHTEAACAGALGVQLGGAHYYSGVLIEKPNIGDATRAIRSDDIVSANRLLYMTALLGLVASLSFGWCICLLGEAFA